MRLPEITFLQQQFQYPRFPLQHHLQFLPPVPPVDVNGSLRTYEYKGKLLLHLIGIQLLLPVDLLHLAKEIIIILYENILFFPLLHPMHLPVFPQ